MDLKMILEQSELAKNAIEQINVQNRIFENTIQQALIDAPEGDKKKINEVQILMNKVTNLAKNGQLVEAQNLIKEFQNGGKNNK
jgi:hypothetical protein